MKEAAERCGMTLGEIKALLFVTTLPAPSWMTYSCLGTVEQEAVMVQKWKEKLGKLASASEYEWGGAHQFGPILNKAIEYYDQVCGPGLMRKLEAGNALLSALRGTHKEWHVPSPARPGTAC